MRLKFAGVDKLNRMGGHHRQTQFGRERNRLPNMVIHIRLIRALDFNVKMIGENASPMFGARPRRVDIAVINGNPNVAKMRAG